MICLLIFQSLGFSPLKNAELGLDPAKMQSLDLQVYESTG